jgi:hypothetical protein
LRSTLRSVCSLGMRWWANTSWVDRVMGAVLLGLAGCTTASQPPPIPQPVVMVDTPSGLTLGAVPAYRLAASPSQADYPSRLLVLNIRLGTTLEGALNVGPENIALLLPNGEQGRVFDRARAIELLHRGTLADVSLAYVKQDGGYPPGGLSDDVRLQLTDTVASRLFADSVFIAGQTLEGFIVVDTGVPFASLNGGSLQVTAYRLRDATPAQAVYPFAAVPAATAEAR